MLTRCRMWFAREALWKTICKNSRGSATGKCCYCEALKIDPEQRSGAMRAVIESETLQLEAGRLLSSNQASSQHEGIFKAGIVGIETPM